MASRDNTIVVALPPGSPRRIPSKEDAKASNSDNSARRNIPGIRPLASNNHSHEDWDEDELDWEKDNDDERMDEPDHEDSNHDESTLPHIHNYLDLGNNSLAARLRDRKREREQLRAEPRDYMEADEEVDNREEEEEDPTRDLHAENPFAAPVRHGGAGHRDRNSDARRGVVGLTARNPFASS